MRTSLPIEQTDYVADFVFMKAKEIWPGAVVLDQEANPRYCQREMACGGSYGFDVFRSEEDVAALFSGEAAPPPSVNVCVKASSINISGEPELVKHLAQHPLWSSR